MLNEKSNFISHCFEDTIFVLTVFLGAMFLFFALFNPAVFLRANNLQSIAFQLSELGILSIAMCLAIIPGGINLSIVAIANLSAIIMMFFIKQTVLWSFSPFLMILSSVSLGVCIGALLGFINGLLIGYLKLPEILATLVTMNVFTGLGIGITEGVTLAGVPQEFLTIGNGTVLGIPIPLLVFLALAVCVRFFLIHSKLGWNIFLIGTNKKVLSLNGVSVAKNLLVTHVLIGIISALAGVIILARTNSASAQYGTSYILSSILVVILGGISISGGKGFFSGIVIAVVFLQVLSTGFNLVLQRVSGGNFFKDFVWGFLLLCMIFINKNTDSVKKIVNSIKNQFKGK